MSTDTGFWPKGNTYARQGHENNHGQFRVTHELLFEGELIAELFRWRGEYYTREGFASGEPGVRPGEFHEGERLRRVFRPGPVRV